MKTSHLAALAASAFVLATLPAIARADHHGEMLDSRFKSADKDGDGTLDKEEAKAMPMVARHFDTLDKDKDGTVSLEEAKAGMKKRMGMAGKRMHDRGKAAFDSADKDKDGTLDKDEAKSMKHVSEHFDEIDGDKDGTVSLEEIHAFMKQHRHDKK